jgi:glycosyltransferase involved in cell wall biosynthesis
MKAVPPMRTLIVDLSERFGGASTRVISLLRELPTDSIALAALFNSPVMQEAQKTGRQLHILATRKSDPRILLRLIRVVREGGYQILDTQNIQSKFWASLAALLTNTTLVSTLNSWYPGEHGRSSLKGNLYLRLEFLTNWKLARMIVVSREIYSALMKKGFTPSRVDMIPNAVALDSSSVPDMRNELLRQYGLSHDAKICLAAGRLVWVKGHVHLIEAFTTLKELPIYCFIVGDGELKEGLETKIHAANLTNNVKLLGYASHERTLALIKACDIFIMPSHYEGTPVALLEAAALARPIIATRVGGIGELVEHEKEALLVEAANPNAIAQAILRLTRDPKWARQLGRSARERVEREFSLPALVDATLATYRKALVSSPGIRNP